MPALWDWIHLSSGAAATTGSGKWPRITSAVEARSSAEDPFPATTTSWSPWLRANRTSSSTWSAVKSK